MNMSPIRRRNRARLVRYTAYSRKKNAAHAKALRAAYRARRNGATGQFTGAEIEGQSLKQDGLCFWYFEALTNADFSIDHYVPLAKGGSNDAANIVLGLPALQ